MPPSVPPPHSIPIANAIARGHIDCGVALYNDYAKGHRTSTSLYSDIRLVAPAATNLALGLELLLKIHHCQRMGRYPTGHDIAKLGRGFSGDGLANLERIYAGQRERPMLTQALNIQLSAEPSLESVQQVPPDLDPLTFESAIDAVGRGYEKWRYFYENFGIGPMADINFRGLLMLIGTFLEAVDTYKGTGKVTIRTTPPT